MQQIHISTMNSSAPWKHTKCRMYTLYRQCSAVPKINRHFSLELWDRLRSPYIMYPLVNTKICCLLSSEHMIFVIFTSVKKTECDLQLNLIRITLTRVWLIGISNRLWCVILQNRLSLVICNTFSKFTNRMCKREWDVKPVGTSRREAPWDVPSSVPRLLNIEWVVHLTHSVH